MGARRKPYQPRAGIAAFKASCRAIKRARDMTPAEVENDRELYRDRPSRRLRTLESDAPSTDANLPWWADL